MIWEVAVLLPLAAAAGAAQAPQSITARVRAAIARHEPDAGERMAHEYRQQHGVTPEMVEALSWVGRGWLAEKGWARAEAVAGETRKLALEMLSSRPLDAERRLPTALGASIEVQAQAMAARGARSEAVAFLQEEVRRWGKTSMAERIHKNLNLLSLEGQPAPPLDFTEWIGAPRVTHAGLRGKTVLLFFWAHWCGDCKNAAPVLARLAERFGSRGLVVLSPTRRYGIAAQGETATPDQEAVYIATVWQRYYPGLHNSAVPLSAANFATYGSSTTPTWVLIDSKGLVRMYRPGNLEEAELINRVAALLRP